MEPMALTPDGSTLVAACRDGVGVWSMATSERHSVVELPGAVSSLAVTPDGATLAAIVDRASWSYAPSAAARRRSATIPTLRAPAP